MVFKTVGENIRSFFQKEERQEPKQVPDAASEALRDPQLVAEHPLPKNISSKETQKPPFSSQELKDALKEKTQQPPPSTITTQEIHELESEYVSDEDLMAFEETMKQISPSEVTQDHTRGSQELSPLKDGFFSSFEEFLTEGSLDETHLDGDLLHKMRVFHQRRQEGKEPLLSKQSTTDMLRPQVA